MSSRSAWSRNTVQTSNTSQKLCRHELDLTVCFTDSCSTFIRDRTFKKGCCWAKGEMFIHPSTTARGMFSPRYSSLCSMLEIGALTIITLPNSLIIVFTCCRLFTVFYHNSSWNSLTHKPVLCWISLIEILHDFVSERDQRAKWLRRVTVFP